MLQFVFLSFLSSEKCYMLIKLLTKGETEKYKEKLFKQNKTL